jgi:hypothetical protein
MSGIDELQWLWPLRLVLLTFHVQILNSLVAVIHCFSFGQWQAVLSRVAEALWGVVLHCALQLPPLSTASYLQLELEVSVLGKCLAAFDSEFTCAAFTAHFFLDPRFTHPPPLPPLQVGHQNASAGGDARSVLCSRIQRTGAGDRLVFRWHERRQSSSLCLSALTRFGSFHLKSPSFATSCTAARA